MNPNTATCMPHRRAALAAAAACLLAVATVAAASASPAPPQLPSVLLLTTQGWGGTDFLEAAMTEYNINYTKVAFARGAPAPNMRELLYTEAGAPRHRALLQYPAVDAGGYLDRSDLAALWEWQRTARARAVNWGAWATYNGYDPDLQGCTSEDRTIGYAPVADRAAFAPAAPFDLAGTRVATAFLSARGLYRCPGLRAAPRPTCSIWGPGSDFETEGLHPTCTSAPLLEFSEPAATRPIAAVMVNYTDTTPGRRAMSFLFDCAEWSPSCRLLGRLSVAWLAEGAALAVAEDAAAAAAAAAAGSATDGDAAAAATAAATATVTTVDDLVAKLKSDLASPPADVEGPPAPGNGAVGARGVAAALAAVVAAAAAALLA